MATCICRSRATDGMCKYKCHWDDKIYCLDLSSARRELLRCVEEDKQLQLVKKRWRLTRVKSRER